ncbi:Calcineurin-binding protein cabin-1 [Pteropus alecto]|uniref:Calcineurin-binding protein cabin-1 n=1 Tax=Pteropus alecto TaxID=9402 RepID=L5KXR7_PTEAL|nr:Calcineurin-binding protein cabin-1 [Pteropus alecto]
MTHSYQAADVAKTAVEEELQQAIWGCLRERSQDSTAVALSDSSSTQDFFNEPTSSLEGSRKPYAEKRLPMPSSQPGPSGKDLPGATEERGMKT